MTKVGQESLIAALRGAGEVIVDPEVLASYRSDRAAPGLLPAGMPAAVVRPATTSQVAAAIAGAAATGCPVVPRGAGSGLSGGANAVEGCLVLSLERMSTILDVDQRGLTATVGAGVINSVLRDAAAGAGLLYAPDPASLEFSTIGGNVATNAGGLCCVKYGVTRDSLLGLEVVLADGRAVRIGRRSLKGVAGYDLVGLMCGSEGTLGVVTEATVRLLPMPPPAHTLAASFQRLGDAGDAVTRLCRRHRPSLLELMDRATIGAVERMQPMELDLEAEAMLFARSDAGRVEGREEIKVFERLCQEAGASIVVTSDEEAEGRMLLAARRLAFPALERGGATLLDDVAVPLPEVPALLRHVERIASEYGLLIGTFGHAGDGNMHPTIVYDRNNQEEVLRARRAFGAILDRTHELGGTITGEHGVGLLKREAAAAELHQTLDLQRRIKATLDPQNLLNPGKML